MVTIVKTRMALLLDSARRASSFCSMVRSWKSYKKVKGCSQITVQRPSLAYHIQGTLELVQDAWKIFAFTLRPVDPASKHVDRCDF